MKLLLLCLSVVLCVAENDNTLEEPRSDEAENRGGGGKLGYNYVKPKAVAPQFWAAAFKDSCAGSSQSPVDLKDAMEMTCDAFEFMGYDKIPSKMNVENNGHTVVVTFDMDPMPSISGGCLPHTYTFAQFHFHWGKNEKKGSEHTIDGKKYPMEIHLVHYNSDEFDSIGDAVESKKSDALAVLGTMVMMGEKSGPYTKLSSVLSKVIKPGKKTTLKPGIKLSNFLPENTDLFYRYMGSLTTPNCYEIVVWTVFKKMTTIKEKKMNKFRKLKDTYMHKLVDNFRPVQKLNGRTIKCT